MRGLFCHKEAVTNQSMGQKAFLGYLVVVPRETKKGNRGFVFTQRLSWVPFLVQRETNRKPRFLILSPQISVETNHLGKFRILTPNSPRPQVALAVPAAPRLQALRGDLGSPAPGREGSDSTKSSAPFGSSQAGADGHGARTTKS